MNITKKGGKWYLGNELLLMPDGTEPKNADDAMNAMAAKLEAASAAGGKVRAEPQGMQTKLEGNILTIVVDLSSDFGQSASGKTRVIATSRGNMPIAFNRPDGKRVFLGLNAYAK